jgi:mRNA-degrading endonuclease RelE of RelBE toxin-antitoxin system
MAWTISISPEAEKQLARIPKNHQDQITAAIERMRIDPFGGDVKPLKGKKWHGRYRKRVGRYRLIFIPFHQTQTVEVSAILPRSEKTYR